MGGHVTLQNWYFTTFKNIITWKKARTIIKQEKTRETINMKKKLFFTKGTFNSNLQIIMSITTLIDDLRLWWLISLASKLYDLVS